MLHADLRFPVKSPDVLDQGIDIGLGMGDVAGGMRITSPGWRMVTVLLPLETSIPTAFITDTPL